MAGTTGTYGSRKGLSRSLPRLTGKAIFPIGEHLSHQEHGGTTTDEGVFLTGLLLCNMWINDKESLLPGKLYDMSFAGAKTDPIGCVESYLNSQDVDIEKLDIIRDNSFRLGYISYDPDPYVGSLSLLDENNNILEANHLYSLIPIDNTTIPHSNFTDEDLKRGYFMRRISVEREFGDIPTDKWDWNTLIFSLSDDHSVGGLIPSFNDPVGWQRVRVLSGRTYDDLENIVRDMIIKGTIIANGKVVSKVILTQD